ncbi:DUF1289 domain-containing protein [Pseudoruegeria sp. HB172150]|uniref:DUF1289 domain-containing protein n=1 Tax=Pseudoruegeria sp. HB172150 TaxID=2721164 RepID=UPI001554173B|nr:DUF1289 domain-containing protein [Pseudoruegeria sp. HB172150]
MDDYRRHGQVESPCVRICVIHPHARICTGCLRSIDEISRWASMSDAERSEVLDDLPGRTGQLQVRRGGRRGRLAGTGQ